MEAKKILKWFFVAAFAFLLWADLLVLSLLFPVQSVSLDKNAWFSALEKADVYEAFVPLGSQMISQSFSAGTGMAVPAAALDPLIRQSFSREWLDHELKKILSNGFDFIENKTETIDLSLSLVEPKQKFLQNVRENGVGLVLLPAVDDAIQRLPDRFELVSAESARAFLLQPRALVSLAHQAVLQLFILALALAILITVLLRNYTVLLALGIVFLLVGLFVLLLSQALSSSVPQLAKQLEMELQAQAHTASSFDFQPIVLAFAGPLGNQIALAGLAEIIVGLLAFGGYWFLRQQKKTTPIVP